MKFLFTGAFLFIKIQFLPNMNLLVWLSIAIVLDFITGVIKARVKNVARTSSGYRKTVTKFVQYAGAIIAGVVLQHVGADNEQLSVLFSWMNNGLVIFITYIEVTSVFENLYEIDSSTIISRYIYKPILQILTFQIKNNPVVKQAKAVEGSENNT